MWLVVIILYDHQLSFYCVYSGLKKKCFFCKMPGYSSFDVALVHLKTCILFHFHTNVCRFFKRRFYSKRISWWFDGGSALKVWLSCFFTWQYTASIRECFCFVFFPATSDSKLGLSDTFPVQPKLRNNDCDCISVLADWGALMPFTIFPLKFSGFKPEMIWSSTHLITWERKGNFYF